MGSNVTGSKFVVSGDASCLGGSSPEVPLDGFTLLAWAISHPVHGSKVFTEDGKASVEDIAMAFVEHPSAEAVAGRYGTTEDHVVQAIDYAATAGYIYTAEFE